MADEIVAPGVERSASEWSGEARYYGTADALTKAGLMPADCPLPGSQPGKRGVRWKDAQGRRHVLAKFRAGDLMLTVYPTAQEAAEYRRASHNAKRNKEIKAELAALCVDEDVWRAELVRLIECGFMAAMLQGFRRDDGGAKNQHWRGPFSLPPELRARLDEHREAAIDLIERAELRRDDTRIQALKRERATIQDKGLQTFLARVVN